MATLRDIKRRIRSVNSTRQITNAMKMIAGARLRRAQERMLSMRPYAREVNRILAGILQELSGVEHTLLEVRPRVKAVGILIVSPDRGLCGGLPGSVLRRATEEIEAAKAAGSEVVLFTSGKKARRAFAGKGANVALTLEGDSERPSAIAAERFAAGMAEAFIKGEIDKARVVYGRFRSAATQDMVAVDILPVHFEGVRERIVQTGGDGAHAAESRPFAAVEIEPDIESLANAVIQRHIGASIYGALLEGAASELGARLTAMDAATRNAGELIEALTLSYNKARQASITSEIIDIVGGVEALK